MNKTIVMIGNTSWGMLRFRGDLMQKFISLGHKVIVIAPKDLYSGRIEVLGAIFLDVEVDRKGTNPFKDLAYLIKLTRIILNIKPDIVLSYTIKPILYGILASWLGNVPQKIAITTGLGNTFNSNNLINKLTKFLYKFVLRFSSEVWFLNTDDAETFILNKLVNKNKVFLLPGEGVDIEHFAPTKMNRNGTFTLISRMLWDKGIGVFVEAARELKKAHYPWNFWLVGPIDPGNPTGIGLAQLQKWHNEGIIKYIGATDDVRSILEQTSCLVHPTYYKEGLPRVLMEACAMGIPCITTEIPGCRDVIADGLNGYLIPPNDHQALAAAILKFMKLDLEAKKSFASECRLKISQNYSSEIINSIYISKLSLLDEVLPLR